MKSDVSDLSAFIRRLPKAELHLHLEGTILPSTLVELSARHDARPLTLPEAEALYQFTDFTGFLDAFKAVTAQLLGPEDYELAAWRMMEHGWPSKAWFTPKSSSPLASFTTGAITIPRPSSPSLPRWSAPANAASANWASRSTGSSMPCATFSFEEAERVFLKAAELRPLYPSIIGIGLGGDERRTPAPRPLPLFMRKPRAGLRLTNHAGETTGPEAIWEALSIGSERIGHALSAIQDPALLQELKARARRWS
jgi:aminodeoxyfutalosine deaminase